MNCSHGSTVRDACGDIICTWCGRVVDRDTFESSWHDTQRTSRPVYKYIDRVRRLGQDLRLPESILEYAASIVDEKSRVTNPDIAAALYAACLEYNVPRTEKEIATVFQIPPKTIARSTSKLRRDGTIPTGQIDVTTCFGRMAQNIEGYDSRHIQRLAINKYESRRHVHANVCVDTLITQCVHDAVSEIEKLHATI